VFPPYFYSMILSATDELGFIPKRIISLVPSQTELLHWLGLEEEIIAITKFCVHPHSWFEQKTRIGGTKAINIDKIKELLPDLIIANKEENVKEQVEMLAGICPVWVTDVNTLEDAYQMINDIGALTGRENKAAELVSLIMANFNVLSQNNAMNPGIPTAYLVWKDPFMTVGGDTFISDMMEKAGLQNIFRYQTRYPETTLSQIRSMNCRLLLLSSEPYPFKEKHITALQQELPGIKILLADGEIFSWYGSRLLLAPDYFKERFESLKIW